MHSNLLTYEKKMHHLVFHLLIYNKKSQRTCMSSLHAESHCVKLTVTDSVPDISMCGLQPWIIMTNIDNLSGPANSMYHTVWAGTLLWHHLVSSHPPTADASEWPTVSPWRPWRTVIQILLPCVWGTGESTEMSQPSLFPPHLLLHYYLFVFWGFFFLGGGVSMNERELGFLGWLTETPGSILTRPLSEQEHSQSCDHDPRLISVHRGLYHTTRYLQSQFFKLKLLLSKHWFKKKLKNCFSFFFSLKVNYFAVLNLNAYSCVLLAGW